MILLITAIAVAAPKVNDHALMRSIAQVEGHRWADPGGAYGIRRATWVQHMRGLPYAYASSRPHADLCAERHLEWLRRTLIADGYVPTVYVLAACWRWGYEGWRSGMRGDYAERVRNLYEDAVPQDPADHAPNYFSPPSPNFLGKRG